MESLAYWRFVQQQCQQAAEGKGWNMDVWAHAELMLAGGDSSEFDGWHTSLSSDFEYQELSVPKDRRK
jgi:hypothetical protein